MNAPVTLGISSLAHVLGEPCDVAETAPSYVDDPDRVTGIAQERRRRCGSEGRTSELVRRQQHDHAASVQLGNRKRDVDIRSG